MSVSKRLPPAVKFLPVSEAAWASSHPTGPEASATGRRACCAPRAYGKSADPSQGSENGGDCGCRPRPTEFRRVLWQPLFFQRAVLWQRRLFAASFPVTPNAAWSARVSFLSRDNTLLNVPRLFRGGGGWQALVGASWLCI